MTMARPESLNLGIGLTKDFDSVSHTSCISTRHYAVKAPLEANPKETWMHDFLDSIDV